MQLYRSHFLIFLTMKTSSKLDILFFISLLVVAVKPFKVVVNIPDFKFIVVLSQPTC